MRPGGPGPARRSCWSAPTWSVPWLWPGSRAAPRCWSRTGRGRTTACGRPRPPPVPRRCTRCRAPTTCWSAGWPSPARPSTGRVLAVAGGRGGAGASTLACALARTAARSAPALLVDADPLGGGLDLAMGVEAAAGLRWPHLVGAEGRTDPHELTAALPAVDGVSVLSWHRGDPTELPPAAMESVLGAARTARPVLGRGPAPSPGPGGPFRCCGRRRRAARRPGRDPGHRGRRAGRGQARGLHRRPQGRGPRARTRRADRRTGRRRARAAAGRLAGAGAGPGGRSRTRRATGPVRPRTAGPPGRRPGALARRGAA